AVAASRGLRAPRWSLPSMQVPGVRLVVAPDVARAPVVQILVAVSGQHGRVPLVLDDAPLAFARLELQLEEAVHPYVGVLRGVVVDQDLAWRVGRLLIAA